MRVHYLQHVPFEGLSSIEPILKERGHIISSTHLYAQQTLPKVSDIDWLIIMGGPMGVYDEAIYPWLGAEKKFIKETIESEKIVLGICLGAQLIADVLGARIVKNKYKEIGWFQINHSIESQDTILSSVIPDHTEVFHWHGDTFNIPEGAKTLASSEACTNQGFILNDKVVGFQFHLESTISSAPSLIENCRDDLDDSQYVQTENEMLSDKLKFSRINQIMHSVLITLEKQYNN
jgi:GMP synthase (glutamine-hydrolysing)